MGCQTSKSQFKQPSFQRQSNSQKNQNIGQIEQFYRFKKRYENNRLDSQMGNIKHKRYLQKQQTASLERPFQKHILDNEINNSNQQTNIMNSNQHNNTNKQQDNQNKMREQLDIQDFKTTSRSIDSSRQYLRNSGEINNNNNSQSQLFKVSNYASPILSELLNDVKKQDSIKGDGNRNSNIILNDSTSSMRVVKYSELMQGLKNRKQLLLKSYQEELQQKEFEQNMTKLQLRYLGQLLQKQSVQHKQQKIIKNKLKQQNSQFIGSPKNSLIYQKRCLHNKIIELSQQKSKNNNNSKQQQQLKASGFYRTKTTSSISQQKQSQQQEQQKTSPNQDQSSIQSSKKKEIIQIRESNLNKNNIRYINSDDHLNTQRAQNLLSNDSKINNLYQYV